MFGVYAVGYDNVNIEGGRPAKVGSSKAEVPDRSIIGDGCWINHGATMHGTQIGEGGAVGLNACCDYNTRIGKGAILANGSATHTDQVIITVTWISKNFTIGSKSYFISIIGNLIMQSCVSPCKTYVLMPPCNIIALICLP